VLIIGLETIVCNLIRSRCATFPFVVAAYSVKVTRLNVVVVRKRNKFWKRLIICSRNSPEEQRWVNTLGLWLNVSVRVRMTCVWQQLF